MLIILEGKVRKNLVRKTRETYAGYRVLNRDFDRRNLDAVIKILSWASRSMSTPKMLHFVLEIEDPDLFETDGFSQRFKEKFNSFIRQRNRIRNKTVSPKRKKLPDIQLIFSLESKYLISAPGVPYNHLHLMVVIDTNHNDYGHRELIIAINRSLSSILGLESLSFDENKAIFWNGPITSEYGFLKFRNEKSSIKIGTFKQLYWHDLKTELADAVCRASYLCKLDQKELLPEKFQRGNSFGHTRPKITHIKNSVKLPNEVTIGAQLDILKHQSSATCHPDVT